MRLNAAVFQSTIDDLQTQFISLFSGGAVALENAGQAETRGAEFDILWSPAPVANPGLSVMANAAWLNAEFKDYPEGSGYDEVTGFYSPNLNFTGNRIPRSPKWSGMLGTTQAMEVGKDGEIEISVDGSYNSGFFFTSQNLDNARQDAFFVLNARAGYLHKPWNLRLTVWAKNLLGEKYYLSVFHNDFGITRTRDYPERYGVRINWDF